MGNANKSCVLVSSLTPNILELKRKYMYLELFERINFTENEKVEFPLDFHSNQAIEHEAYLLPDNKKAVEIFKCGDYITVPLFSAKITDLEKNALSILRAATKKEKATIFKHTNIEYPNNAGLYLCIREWNEKENYCYVGLVCLDGSKLTGIIDSRINTPC